MSPRSTRLPFAAASMPRRCARLRVSLLAVAFLTLAVSCTTEGTTGVPSVDATDMFTDRDLEQTPDTVDATELTLSSGEDVTIGDEGVYVLGGSYQDVTVVVEAGEEASVQLVLAGLTIVNADAPAIFVRSADKVFVTTSEGSENRLEVTGTFVPDGTTNLDGVIFAKDDVVLNGTGALEIVSALENGVVGKDDVKVTGGTLVITAAKDGIEANESIRIGGGDIFIESGADGLHSENDEDDATGFVYVGAGALSIAAVDDGVRGTVLVQIDGGSVDVLGATEGIEATFVQVNGGDLSVLATDDGINATNKSSAADVAIEVNGGTLFVEVGEGDTDAFDSNGDITINDGVIDVVAPRSAFDADGVATLNGGTVTVNGSVITTITTSGPGGAPGASGPP